MDWEREKGESFEGIGYDERGYLASRGFVCMHVCVCVCVCVCECVCVCACVIEALSLSFSPSLNLSFTLSFSLSHSLSVSINLFIYLSLSFPNWKILYFLFNLFFAAKLYYIKFRSSVRLLMWKIQKWLEISFYSENTTLSVDCFR